MSAGSGSGCTCSGACGCFEGITARTPVEIDNRPGLATIRYRTGTHSTFKASMLAALSNPQRFLGVPLPGALSDLRTRDDDDFSIALLDAVAVVADVLTFYHERIANEKYLGTATDRRSILLLARAVGYELQPGVAASTVLAFSMDTTPGAPATSRVPVGTKVQSVPDPGQTAVTFETVEAIEARPAWNAMRPRQSVAQPLPYQTDHVVFQGTATNIKPGDGVLFTVGTGQVAFGIATTVTVTPDVDATRSVTDVIVRLLSDGRRTDLSLPQQSDPDLGPAAQELLDRIISEEDLRVYAASQKLDVGDLFANLTLGSSAPAQAVVLRSRAAVFGHNAPAYATLPGSLTEFSQVFTNAKGTTAWPEGAYHGRGSWNGVDLSAYATDQIGDPNTVILDTTYSTVSEGGYAVLRSGDTWAAFQLTAVTDTSYADFTLSTKATSLTLDSTTCLDQFRINATTVFVGGELLPLARVTDTTSVTGAVVLLDGWIQGLQVGQQVVVQGESADARGTTVVESTTLTSVDHLLQRDGGTQLTLSPELLQSYLRTTVTVNGNVAGATHGETVHEVVGSGDAGQAYQQFQLRQPPVTHVSTRTPSGASSTLQLWVDDQLWREVPYLHGADPKDRVFVTRIDDSAVPTLTAGDGRENGARFPTGRENIRAVYRKGIGLGGRLRAGQLTMLTTRPAGVRGVTNPLPATGADDPETTDRARRNAPLRVRTLDRIVSLQDYQDFAQAFAGVAKALASWSLAGQVRGVMVTVAAPGGEAIEPGGRTYDNLLAAMQAAGDPYVPLRLASFDPVTFTLTAGIRVAGDREPQTVLRAVSAALRTRFGFDARSFGQSVSVSEVIAVMQAVTGVVAVDLRTLVRSDTSQAENLPSDSVLPARLPRAGQSMSAMQPAELLTLDPAPVGLETF